MTLKLTRRQALIGLSTSCAALALTSGWAVAQTNSLRIGTSSTGSVFYTLGVGAGEIIRDVTGINTTVEPVGGSAANVNAIARGDIDMAIANSFAAFSGYMGQHAFKKPIDLRLAVQGQSSYRWIFVRSDAGIKTPKDLEGKTVIGARASLPELSEIMAALIAEFDLDESKINVVSTGNSKESIEAIRTGTVDAIIMPYSPRAGNIEKAMSDGAMVPLVISAKERDAVLARLPEAFFSIDQSAEMFSNQPSVVPLVALKSYLITSPQVDEDAIYSATKAMLENVERFGTFHAAGKRWTLKNTLSDPALPFHEGSIRYFKEIGVWTDELETTQRRLLSRS
ncbi:MAG: hypothetical protein COA52_08445 [Hyphomicrobiales bacterium]|nr:TAXI family TRAP transporter solute-binding subunit [Hyphomicrobiales bacterium]PCJ91558.1 MAG: hypothetical protein COA52_08445 [Hyphomicrobiales bacterium]